MLINYVECRAARNGDQPAWGFDDELISEGGINTVDKHLSSRGRMWKFVRKILLGVTFWEFCYFGINCADYGVSG